MRTVEALVDAMVRLAGEGRRRSLARHACVVEGVRDPELREILVLRVNAGREAVRHFLATRDVTDPETRTHTLLICFVGLVLDRLVRPARDELALTLPAISALFSPET